MKLHYGKTTFPWRLTVSLPSIYTKESEIRAAQMGPVKQAYGVSFGQDRFIGIIIAGPVVTEQERVARPPSPSTREGQ